MERDKELTKQLKNTQKDVFFHPNTFAYVIKGFVDVLDVKGAWVDHWVSNDFCFTFISELPSNKIVINGFVPEKLHKQTLQLRINKHCQTIDLNKGEFTLEIPVDLSANTPTRFLIKAENVWQPSGPERNSKSKLYNVDTRELAFNLRDIVVISRDYLKAKKREKGLTASQLYPIPDRSFTPMERIASYLKKMIGFCNICGRWTIFLVSGDTFPELREGIICQCCRSSNRKRQIAFVLCEYLSSIKANKKRHLRGLQISKSVIIYNTEAQGALHNVLKKHSGYYCSEYFGPDYESGSKVNGIYHEDLMNLSLEDESVDIVISSDVFEHIPNPYKAHQELYRVLKKKGRHIFTVPFNWAEFLDEERTRLKNDCTVEHLAVENGYTLRKPEYHGDPLRAEGALVYRIFSLEMLCKLRGMGFVTKFYKLYKPWYGILGNDALVFEAIKA